MLASWMRSRFGLILVVVLALLSLGAGSDSANALLGADRAATAQESSSSPGPWQNAIQTVRTWQLQLQRELTATARGIKTDPNWVTVATLLAAGFIYGVLHAAGPGHGKIVVASYLVATRAQMRRGLQLAVLSSLTQALSAIALVGLLVMVLDLPRMEASGKTRLLEIASYGLIAALGAWMLLGIVRGRGCDHDHGHAPVPEGETGHGHDPLPAWGLRHMLAPILAIGIRPCTGAVIILLFTLAQGILLAGIGATLAMAFGTALTVAALAILTVTSRRAALRLAGGNALWVHRAHKTLAFLGALAILGFGVIMFTASLSQQGPAF